MKVTLLSVGSKAPRGKREQEDLLVNAYLERTSRFVKATGQWVATESHLWQAVETAAGRSAAKVILMDSTGRQLTSVEFAEAIGGFRDRGAQQIIVGIGGPDGWTPEARGRADLVVSMGRMTLPHSLARVIAAEQIYRAMTILAGHPYHCGH